MGIQFDIERELERKYKSAVYKMGDIMLYRLARPWLYIDILYRLTPSYWKQLYLAGILHVFSKTVIRKREKDFVGDSKEETEVVAKKKKIMLDMLLLAKEKGSLLDLDGIREEVDTFIFEGHDTTSISLGFTLMLLANHSEIQVQNKTKRMMEVTKLFFLRKRHVEKQ